jgi:hypothetical protein
MEFVGGPDSRRTPGEGSVANGRGVGVWNSTRQRLG